MFAPALRKLSVCAGHLQDYRGLPRHCWTREVVWHGPIFIYIWRVATIAFPNLHSLKPRLLLCCSLLARCSSMRGSHLFLYIISSILPCILYVILYLLRVATNHYWSPFEGDAMHDTVFICDWTVLTLRPKATSLWDRDVALRWVIRNSSLKQRLCLLLCDRTASQPWRWRNWLALALVSAVNFWRHHC